MKDMFLKSLIKGPSLNLNASWSGNTLIMNQQKIIKHDIYILFKVVRASKN